MASQESTADPAHARLPGPQPSPPPLAPVPPPLERLDWWPALLAGALALTVYILTLAPGLTFDNYGTDGGDLVTAAYGLGVPHPTGYPTYTLLAWLFTRLPLGAIAYRVNLLSAFCAAGSVVLTFRIAQHLLPAAEPELDAKQPWLLPAAAALTLAFASLLWSQAVISEVYALLAFLAALLLWLLLRWRQGGRDHYLWLAALVFGLGLGNHVTLAFAAPFALVWLWPDRARWSRPPVLLAVLCFFLAGLSVYTYLPLAARQRPPVNWGNPQTWHGFLWVVTAKQYQPFAFGLDWAAIPDRLVAWAGLLGQQFGWWGLVLILMGAWSWWGRDRVLSLAALAWMLSVAGYAFLYDTGDSHLYLVSILPFLALCWGEGAAGLISMFRSRTRLWRRLVLVTIALLPLLSLCLHWGGADPDDDGEVHAYYVQALEAVEPGALILVRGDRPTFALWYAVYAEQQRTDVAIVSGPLLAFVWYREHIRHLYPQLVAQEPGLGEVTIDDLVRDMIANNLDWHPVYATDPSDAWKAAYDFVQVGNAPVYRVVEQDVTSP